MHCHSFVKTFLSTLLAIAIAVTVFVVLAPVSAFAQTVQNQTIVALPQITEAMRQYSHIRYAMYFAGTAYMCAILFGLMATGVSAAIRSRVEQLSRNEILRFLCYSASIYLLIWALIAPIAYFSGFSLEHLYKLSEQNLVDWFGDQLKMMLMGFCLSAPVFGAFFWLVRKFPRRWPILFCLISSAFIGLETFIEPLVLEPVLNKFTAMPPGNLRDSIEKLASVANAPGAPILTADKSKQTNKLNAYVSGLGSSTHIVIWDTTLKQLPEDQVLAIVGHELGHYYHRHVLIGFLLAVGVNILIVPINMYLARPFIARLPASWKVRGLDDYAVVPTLLLVAALANFLFDPAVNAFSRMEEHEADAFSARVTGNAPALARSFVSISEQNLSEPDPPAFIKFWLFSHPTLKERIDFANSQSSPGPDSTEKPQSIQPE